MDSVIYYDSREGNQVYDLSMVAITSWMFEREIRKNVNSKIFHRLAQKVWERKGRADSAIASAIGPQMKNLVSNLDLPIRSTNSSSSPVICY